MNKCTSDLYMCVHITCSSIITYIPNESTKVAPSLYACEKYTLLQLVSMHTRIIMLRVKVYTCLHKDRDSKLERTYVTCVRDHNTLRMRSTPQSGIHPKNGQISVVSSLTPQHSRSFEKTLDSFRYLCSAEVTNGFCVTHSCATWEIWNNRHTDKPTTITLAVHARQGLTRATITYLKYHCQLCTFRHKLIMCEWLHTWVPSAEVTSSCSMLPPLLLASYMSIFGKWQSLRQERKRSHTVWPVWIVDLHTTLCGQCGYNTTLCGQCGQCVYSVYSVASVDIYYTVWPVWIVEVEQTFPK